MRITGAAHTFGDNVNTDYITPTDYFGLSLEEIVPHLFEPIAPAFADRFEPGDLIVAGENFGSGSSREHAPQALKTAGVSAVVAESIARIFYRNGIAIGLPVITASGVRDIVEQGDDLEIDFDAGRLHNRTHGSSCQIESMPPEIRAIFDAGGLLAHYERHPHGLVDREP